MTSQQRTAHAGVDAGVDAGADAGVDAGVDEGRQLPADVKGLAGFAAELALAADLDHGSRTSSPGQV